MARDPVASEAIDLIALTAEAQREIDDASEDHLYVTRSVAPPLTACAAGGMRLGTPEENARRIEALKFAAVSAARMWRANGGRGRAVVTFSVAVPPDVSDQMIAGLMGLEFRIEIWTSAGDAFEALRERAA